MERYINLSSIIDVEPYVDLVLDLINDENLVIEVAKRRDIDVIIDILDMISYKEKAQVFKYLKEDFVDWLKEDDSDKEDLQEI